MVNYYVELGLNPKAIDETLKQDLSKLRRKWQNRANCAFTLEDQREADHMMDLVREASDVLLTPEKRERYDRKISMDLHRYITDSINDKCGLNREVLAKLHRKWRIRANSATLPEDRLQAEQMMKIIEIACSVLLTEEERDKNNASIQTVPGLDRSKAISHKA